MLKNILFSVIFLLVCAYGYLAVENTNGSKKIGDKAENVLKSVRIIDETEERLNSNFLVVSKVRHLVSIRSALVMGTAIIQENPTYYKSAAIEIRSFEAKTALDVLDEIRDDLGAMQGFPMKKFNKDLSVLRNELEKGSPDVAIERLSLMIDFL